MIVTPNDIRKTLQHIDCDEAHQHLDGARRSLVEHQATLNEQVTAFVDERVKAVIQQGRLRL